MYGLRHSTPVALTTAPDNLFDHSVLYYGAIMQRLIITTSQISIVLILTLQCLLFLVLSYGLSQVVWNLYTHCYMYVLSKFDYVQMIHCEPWISRSFTLSVRSPVSYYIRSLYLPHTPIHQSLTHTSESDLTAYILMEVHTYSITHAYIRVSSRSHMSYSLMCSLCHTYATSLTMTCYCIGNWISAWLYVLYTHTLSHLLTSRSVQPEFKVREQ